MALPQVQSPMSEEDESAETASEGAEPLTPVTDTTPHSFHHQQDATICQVASLPIDETPKFCHIVPPSNATRTPPSYPPPPPPPALTTSFAPPVPSKFSQESDRSDALTSPVDIGSAVDTPKKELPSLYDVPAGWRKTSTDRGRSTVERDSLDSKPAGTNAERKTSPGKPKPGISKAPTAPINSEPKRNIVTRANTFFGRLKRMPSKKFDENPVVSSTPPPPPFDASKPISSTNRAPSKKLEDSPAPPASQPALALPFDASKPISATNRPAKTFEDSPAPTSQLLPAPQFDASKPRSSTNRLPSIPISQSARQTPATSASHTPPSPSSTSSNTAEDGLDDERLRKVTTTGGHMHSKPQNGAPDFGHQGITWKTPAYAPGQTRPNPEHLRRRSASTDQIQKMTRMRKPNEPVPESAHPEAVMLFPTFSKHANEGTGLKARRLSTSLPDQFHVDHCELNKEFKASKLFARRGKTVGKGATAEVTIMARKDSKDAALVAVKEFRGKEKDEDELDYVKKVKSEYTIAKSLHHPNIVETIRLCTHSGRWNHVMEFCDVGDLYHLVEKGLFRSHYKYEDKICMWKQIIRGVDYLHSHGIAHRDVKLENILMTHEGYIKITDFGVSEVFSGEHPGLRVAGGQCGRNMGEVRKCAPGICGSLPYIAPEVLAKSGEYDPRPLDVWSCAIVYVTMHFGGPPWHAAKPDQPNYQKFINGWDKWKKDHPSAEISNEQGGWPKCGELFALIDPPGLRRLLLKMLHPEPEKRVTIRDVLTKSFIKGIDCCSPETVDDGDGACCGKIDASKGKVSASASESKKIKHNHVPPREHKTPKVLQHRFDMGDGWN